jgi:hypothetical protein
MNPEDKYSFSLKVWCLGGSTPWRHYVIIPKKISEVIYNEYQHKKKNFESIHVNARIGESKWKASIIYNSKIESFALPVKPSIVKKEKILQEKKIIIDIEINL